MKDITAVAIDTAKTTFYLVGFSVTGDVVGRRKYGGEALKRWLVKLNGIGPITASALASDVADARVNVAGKQAYRAR